MDVNKHLKIDGVTALLEDGEELGVVRCLYVVSGGSGGGGLCEMGVRGCRDEWWGGDERCAKEMCVKASPDHFHLTLLPRLQKIL